MTLTKWQHITFNNLPACRGDTPRNTALHKHILRNCFDVDMVFQRHKTVCNISQFNTFILIPVGQLAH